MGRYEVRRSANENSRSEAEKNREFWSPEEVEFLENFWNDTPLEEIALTLGRTIEACRQKHYDLDVRRTTAIKPVSKWSAGFTSLADMGY